MAFKFITRTVLLFNLYSCASDSKTNEIEDTPENKIEISTETNTVETGNFSDSSMSFINLNSTTPKNLGQGVDFSNTIYSLESFKFNDSLKHFVCKATIEETRTSTWSRGNRSEKFEFFDYGLEKQFEISASRREIELDYDYFITRSLFTDFPRIFELNNYETNQSFVKCSGICWSANIPNGETTAYFGYQSSSPSSNENMEHLGTLYYGLNGNPISELRFFYYPKQRYHGIVSFSLEPNIEGDRMSYSNSDIRELTLWSQNGKSGEKFITDFEIKVNLKREKEHKSNNYESLEYIINVKEGKLQGKGLKSTDYGYQLILL